MQSRKKKIFIEVLKHIVRAFVILLLFAGLLFLFDNEYLSDRGRREYSGVVVDKWVGISETLQGSYLFPVILVKTESGELIRARVNAETYKRLRLFTRVKHDSAGIRIEQTVDSYDASMR